MLASPAARVPAIDQRARERAAAVGAVSADNGGGKTTTTKQAGVRRMKSGALNARRGPVPKRQPLLLRVRHRSAPVFR